MESLASSSMKFIITYPRFLAFEKEARIKLKKKIYSLESSFSKVEESKESRDEKIKLFRLDFQRKTRNKSDIEE
jgi:hypothetical protein